MSAEIMMVQDQLAYAQAVCKSDIIPDAYRGKPANVVIAIGFGQSMGLSPAESLYRINVIKGKPTMSAELIAAQVRKAGHKLRLAKDEQRQSVTATIVRSDDPDYPISVTRDRKWAEDMGLAQNINYKKQGMTMLTWRAITACAREACPEALFGVAYTPDEMHDMDERPVHVEAVQEPVERKDERLQPIRDLFHDFMAAVGCGSEDAMAMLTGYVGVASMDEMDDTEIGDALIYMRDVIARAKEVAA